MQVVGLMAAGRSATFMEQRDDSRGGLMWRVPLARSVERIEQSGVNDRPV